MQLHERQPGTRDGTFDRHRGIHESAVELLPVLVPEDEIEHGTHACSSSKTDATIADGSR